MVSRRDDNTKPRSNAAEWPHIVKQADEGRAILHPQRLDVTQPVLVGRLARDQHHDPPAQRTGQHGHGFQHVRPVLVHGGAGVAADHRSLPAMASASARGERLFLWRGRREIVHVDPVLHRAQATAGVVRAHQAAPGMFADADHAIRGRATPRPGCARNAKCAACRRSPDAHPAVPCSPACKAGDRPRRSHAPVKALDLQQRAHAPDPGPQRAIRP